MAQNHKILIGNRDLGLGFAYVIAEAGVNHNGSLERALELVRRAKEVGADCVKFQTFRAEAIVTKRAPKANYQLKVTDPEESQLEMLRKLELKQGDFASIKALCEELGVEFLSTPYSYEDVDLLQGIGVNAFKVASGQICELPFLEYIARLGKPMIISTGMANMAEVEAAVECIRAAGNHQIVVLQCTTNYPSKIAEANIRAMQTIGSRLAVMVGYSDHTETEFSAYASIALGARVIERHFTLDRNLPGPDHSCSLEPKEFAAYIRGLRMTEESLGSAAKEPTESERANAVGMRRSLVAAKPIRKGDLLDRSHFIFKRPATGLSPNELHRFLNRRAERDLAADEFVTVDLVLE